MYSGLPYCCISTLLHAWFFLLLCKFYRILLLYTYHSLVYSGSMISKKKSNRQEEPYPGFAEQAVIPDPRSQIHHNRKRTRKRKRGKFREKGEDARGVREGERDWGNQVGRAMMWSRWFRFPAAARRRQSAVRASRRTGMLLLL